MNFLIFIDDKRNYDFWKGDIPIQAQNVVLLIASKWDDYTYKTSFIAKYCDNVGKQYDLGVVKIARGKMISGERIVDSLDKEFDYLPEGYFSLWQTAEAYKRVLECEKVCGFGILESLNDITYYPELFEKYQDEDVVRRSIFREVSVSLYKKQFRRIVAGQMVLIPYHFSYVIKNTNPYVEDCTLNFSVVPDSLPPTNVHAVIGSNGTGKTTLLKRMIKAISKTDEENNMFVYDDTDDENGVFENIICISFNPFDDYSDIENCGAIFKYIGVRKKYNSYDSEDQTGSVSLLDDIRIKYIDSLKKCLIDVTKKDDLREVLKTLETEYNFLSGNYGFDLNIDNMSLDNMEPVEKFFERLSAGHKVVLSIITRCIDELVEKSIVFIDEPENHLHPPLLSSMICGISRLLRKRNGVAIISTHSPIVLQEIPKSSVWILNRVGDSVNAKRPEIETFGTNIGVLTNEIFGYEVKRTGFITLLQSVVDKFNDYDSVLKEFNYQLGDEAKSMIRIMLKEKEMQ